MMLNNSKLASVKRKLEREAGIYRPRLHRAISVQVDVESYISDRQQISETRDQLKRSQHNEDLDVEIYMLYIHGKPRKEIRPSDASIFEGVPGFEVRIVTQRQLIAAKRKREQMISKCAFLCKKKELTFREMQILSDSIAQLSDICSDERISTLITDMQAAIDRFI